MKNTLFKKFGLFTLLLSVGASAPTMAQTESAQEKQEKPEPPKVTTAYDDIKGETKVSGPSIQVVKIEASSDGGLTLRSGVNLSANYTFSGEKPQRPASVNIRLDALVYTGGRIKTDNGMENVKTLYIKYGDKRASFPVTYSREMMVENVGSDFLTAIIPTDVFVQIGRSPSVQLQYEIGENYSTIKGEVTPDNMFALRMVVDEIAKAKK